MTSSSDKRDDWLDDELRDVPLPEGLIARLKALCEGPDAQFDAALCDIGLPDGLLNRIKAVARNEAFDKQVRSVSIPDGLLSKLHSIAAYDDDEIDAQLRDVPTPEGLIASLHTIATPRRAVLRWLSTATVEWAVAASLLVGLGLAYLGARSASITTADREPSKPIVIDDDSAERVEGLAAEPAAVGENEDGLPDAERLGNPAVASQFDWEDFRNLNVATNPLAPGPDLELVDPLADVLLSEEELLAGRMERALPELQMVERRSLHGVAPPRVKGFDLLSYVRDRVHPFVSPSADAELRRAQVPLVTSTTSLDDTLQALRDSRLPPVEAIRAEDFLAGMDYGFLAPSEDALALCAAGGPSPFGDEGANLLQVGVQAISDVRRVRPATHLIVAVDTSASMGRGNRLNRVRRAIGELAMQLGPQDRLTLIGVGETSGVVLEGAQRTNVDAIRTALESIVGRNVGNLGAGLQTAIQTAAQVAREGRLTARVALVTDGIAEMTPGVSDRIEALLARTANDGVTLDLVHVSADRAVDASMLRLVDSGRGRVYEVNTAQAVRFALWEALTGNSPVVAARARLTVTFNPETVEKYRLIGHEAEALAGLVAGSVHADLRVGEAATALFELHFKPSGGDDVAVAELVWEDPVSGETQVRRQRISRLQFATSVSESPLPLQRAMVAAEAAEIFRGSIHAPSHSSGLARVLEFANQLSPLTQQEASFKALLAMVEAAQRVQAGKPPTPAGSKIWWWRNR